MERVLIELISPTNRFRAWAYRIRLRQRPLIDLVTVGETAKAKEKSTSSGVRSGRLQRPYRQYRTRQMPSKIRAPSSLATTTATAPPISSSRRVTARLCCCATKVGDENNWLPFRSKAWLTTRARSAPKSRSSPEQIDEIETRIVRYLDELDRLHRRLGQAKEADVVRMLWPSGVIQDEIQIAGMKDHSLIEMDTAAVPVPRSSPATGRAASWSNMLARAWSATGSGPAAPHSAADGIYKEARNSIREKRQTQFPLHRTARRSSVSRSMKLLAVDRPARLITSPTNISPAIHRLRRSKLCSPRRRSTGGGARRAWP